MSLLRTVWMLAAAALAGCAVGPAPRGPDVSLPAHWTGASPTLADAEPLSLDWWTRFSDPLLTQYIERALANNKDVRIAQARLRSARAARAIARADFAPSVSGTVSAGRVRNGNADGVSSYAAGFDASWEIDVFGGLRRAHEAAAAEADAAAATLAATRVSLAAEVARNYIELRALQLRSSIAGANLDSQSETLQLVQWRVQAGLASSLDLEQARSNREQTRAQLPALEAALAQSRHALAVLLAEPPAALDAQLEAPSTPVLPQLDARRRDLAIGIPADLLRRRPDVFAAERTLSAAAARVGAAQAARYPSFALSGSIGLEALSLNALDGSEALTRSLLARIAAPVFDAGRLRQQVEQRSAAEDEALASYEATLLAALRDVEDALTAITRGRQRAEALALAAEAARNAARLSRQRYSAGLVDFSTVLDAERTRLSVEDSVAITAADNLAALLSLYKALGGGWDTALASTDLNGTRR